MEMRRSSLLTACVLLFSAVCHAQDKAAPQSTVQRESAAEKKKQRTDYMNELEKMKRENLAKYEDYKKTMTLGLQMLLGEAGYGIGPFDGIMDAKTENAL